MGKYRHKPKDLTRKATLRKEAKTAKEQFAVNVRNKIAEIRTEIGPGNITPHLVRLYGDNTVGLTALGNFGDQMTNSAKSEYIRLCRKHSKVT